MQKNQKWKKGRGKIQKFREKENMKEKEKFKRSEKKVKNDIKNRKVL